VAAAAGPEARDADLELVEGIAGLRSLKQRVSFAINLGYQIDGARPSGVSTVGGNAPIADADYATFRSYGFGEFFGSARRIYGESLSAYLALRFQAATRPEGNIAQTRALIPQPIATWFERSGVEVRTGWAELTDFLPEGFKLKNLRVRAGDFFVYGPWIMHLDGVQFAFESSLVSAAAYGGYRHSDYTREQSDARPGITGASLRFDLRGVTNAVPIAIAAEYLGLTASNETGQGAHQTAKIEVDWRPRRDVALIANTRTIDGEVANQRAELRVRYKQVTNFVFDVMRRFASDWRWDPSLVGIASSPALEERRFLDLGPVVPQLIGSVRAGTLIADNIDLFGRAAVSYDETKEGDPQSAYAAPYVELAGGLEVRLRRAVAFGAAVLSRQTSLPELETKIRDEHDVIQPLQQSAILGMGQRGFTEVSTSVRLTLGARKFSSFVEVFGRRTRFAELYVDPQLPVTTDELHGGGRISIEAWVGNRVRLFAQYEISSELDLAPEITGYKSLRLALSGVY
ncbi:MAG: hypothetical protein KIT31_31705, partial [Deltaproteobacteria bacterium]|nr:hypothetical protein [Deltaproteobacteria bacterium]